MKIDSERRGEEAESDDLIWKGLDLLSRTIGSKFQKMTGRDDER